VLGDFIVHYGNDTIKTRSSDNCINIGSIGMRARFIKQKINEEDWKKNNGLATALPSNYELPLSSYGYAIPSESLIRGRISAITKRHISRSR